MTSAELDELYENTLRGLATEFPVKTVEFLESLKETASKGSLLMRRVCSRPTASTPALRQRAAIHAARLGWKLQTCGCRRPHYRGRLLFVERGPETADLFIQAFGEGCALSTLHDDDRPRKASGADLEDLPPAGLVFGPGIAMAARTLERFTYTKFLAAFGHCAPPLQSDTVELLRPCPDECWRCCSAQTVGICGGCLRVMYCSLECQRLDWSEHKPYCQGTDELA